MLAGSTTVPGGRRPRSTLADGADREAGGAERCGRLGEGLAGERGTARSGAVWGLTLPAASFWTSVKLRVSPAANAPSLASNSVGPNSR